MIDQIALPDRRNDIAGDSGRVHGGPDGGPPIAYDFSTNANAAGPAPSVLAAVLSADRTRYPDPLYAALCERLARHHRVDASRIRLAAGTSEAVQRLTAAASLQGVESVWVPKPGYGDYAYAARAHKLVVVRYHDVDALVRGLQQQRAATLVWVCEPCNPTGGTIRSDHWHAIGRCVQRAGAVLAIDRAYEPLRLLGSDPVPLQVADRAWQWWSPNKSLGMTGVRAAYAIAPAVESPAVAASFDRLASSWVLGADGVAFLESAVAHEAVAWLEGARTTLSGWREAQASMLRAFGWDVRASVVPFHLARPSLEAAEVGARLVALRSRGIKLRDATSFGMPGWVRLSVQAPAAQQAFAQAWQQLCTARMPP